jgi:hypothetical protein
MRRLGLVFLYLSVPFAAFAVTPTGPAAQPAQPVAGQASAKAALVEDFDPRKVTETLPTPGNLAQYAPDPGATLDPATRDRQQAAWRAYYNYRVWAFQHRTELYDWQLTSSRVTFVVVILLVLIGIFFSWLQFRLSLQPRPPVVPSLGLGPPPAEVAVAAVVTEISAGREGIKVSSPVLGVIILVISLLFFYLYLAYVYPLNQAL